MTNRRTVYYSFDLSYYLGQNISDSDVNAIVNKYPSCKWCSSELEPVFLNGMLNPLRNNGYKIYNIDEFKSLIEEVNKTSSIFIGSVIKYLHVNDNNPQLIYYAANYYDQMFKICNNRYIETIKNITNNDLEIYNLITKINQPLSDYDRYIID